MSGTLPRLAGPSDPCPREPEVKCPSEKACIEPLPQENASADLRQRADAGPEPSGTGRHSRGDPEREERYGRISFTGRGSGSPLECLDQGSNKNGPAEPESRWMADDPVSCVESGGGEDQEPLCRLCRCRRNDIMRSQ